MSSLKRRVAGAAIAAVGLCGLAGTALAAPGFTATSVSLRAGPGPDYPSIVFMRRGTPVEVYGCLDEFSWCDVDAEGQRGWVRGSKLDVGYDGRRVLLPYYGPRIGLPIVTFSFGDYWNRYYRDRPFFADRERWGRLSGWRPGGYPDNYGRPPSSYRPDVGGPGPLPPLARPDRGPDYGRPGVVRPDLGRPDVGRPDTARPDGGRPDVDTGRPSIGRPDAGRPDNGRPDANRPSGTRPPAFSPTPGPVPVRPPTGGPRPDMTPSGPGPRPGTPRPTPPAQPGAPGKPDKGDHKTPPTPGQ